MNKLGGWTRLWIVVSLLGLLVATFLAFCLPDLYSTVDAHNKRAELSKAKFYFSDSQPTGPVTISSCLPGTLRERPDEQLDDEYTLLGGFDCTSYQRLYLFLAYSIAFSQALLVLGASVYWVRSGFKKE